jgi:hypothetical protein
MYGCVYFYVVHTLNSVTKRSNTQLPEAASEEKIFEKVYDVRRTDDDDGRQVMAIVS